MTPYAGVILGGLVEALWPPDGTDVWGEIKDQVEALMDQKLDDDKYNTVKGNLEGLQNVTSDYQQALVDKDNENIRTNWTNLKNDFDLYQPNFQQSGYELLLLPLFGQFATMYLAVLRDAVIHGSEWGMDPKVVSGVAKDLPQYITEFTTYIWNWYVNEVDTLQQNTPVDSVNNIEPFKTVNTFKRSTALTVLDFVDTWPFLISPYIHRD